MKSRRYAASHSCSITDRLFPRLRPGDGFFWNPGKPSPRLVFVHHRGFLSVNAAETMAHLKASQTVALSSPHSVIG